MNPQDRWNLPESKKEENALILKKRLEAFSNKTLYKKGRANNGLRSFGREWRQIITTAALLMLCAYVAKKVIA